MSTTKKTNSTQTVNQTTTPSNPSWVEPQISGLAGRVGGLANADPSSFVAGPSALQTTAAANAAGLGTNPAYGRASDIFSRLANTGGYGYDPATAGASTAGASLMGAPDEVFGAKGYNYIQPYMSPYTNDVVNTSLADYDVGAGQTRAQNKLSLANDDTFGGSGGAIQTTLSNDAIDRGRGALSAGLRNQGFQTALTAAQSDADRVQQARLADQAAHLTAAGANQSAQNQFSLADMDALNQFGLANQAAQNQAWQFNAGATNDAQSRQLAAGQGLATTGATQDESARQNIAAQSGLGSTLQQIAQTQAGAPINTLGSIISAYGGLPLNLLQGQTVNGTETGNSTSTTGGLGAALGSLGAVGMGLGSLGFKPFGK